MGCALSKQNLASVDRYNPLNQLTQITLPGTNQNFTPTYYKDLGQFKQLTYPSGITTDYTYEDNGPIKQIKTQTNDPTPVILEQLDYVYDEVLNIGTQESNREGGIHDYTYDDLDRLTRAVHPAATGIAQEDYEYDKVGNREVPGSPGDYGYDANHRITTSPTGITYTFDDDGNILTRVGGATTENFTHNKNNRLSDYSKSGTTASYQYDPFGRRISKTVNGTTTYFAWDGNQIIAEYNGAGMRARRYAYLPSGLNPIQIEDANGIYNVHSDHLQTPQFLTDTSQQVVWNQSQETFGKSAVNTDPDNNSTDVVFNMRFPGQYHDEESGLHQNFYRSYDPETGRYLKRDPIGIEGGVNTYIYVLSNPTIYIDPLGLDVYGFYNTGRDSGAFHGRAAKGAGLDNSKGFTTGKSLIDGLKNSPNITEANIHAHGASGGVIGADGTANEGLYTAPDSMDSSNAAYVSDVVKAVKDGSIDLSKGANINIFSCKGNNLASDLSRELGKIGRSDVTVTGASTNVSPTKSGNSAFAIGGTFNSYQGGVKVQSSGSLAY